MDRSRTRRLLVTIGLTIVTSLLVQHAIASDSRRVGQDEGACTSFGNLPLYFVENHGQLPESVGYTLEGADKTLYFTPEGVTFALVRDGGRWSLKLDFIDANPDVKPRGGTRDEAVFSYFQGRPENWHVGAPAWRGIVYEDLWPGIDLAYNGTVNRLKYEFVVAPGADPGRIRLAYRGATGLRTRADGSLEVATAVGALSDAPPVAYQTIDGTRREVAVSYDIEPAGEGSFAYGFDLGDYDRDHPLIVDPEMLIYCGYIGGAGFEDGAHIAVDAEGCAYVTGTTDSSSAVSFPVTVGPDLTFNGGNVDAYVAKVNASGTGLVYCGYIGGAGDDYGSGIAVDAAGNAYVAGATRSDESTFPVVVGPDLTHGGTTAYDAFVAKVNPTGTALVYCGYIGGAAEDPAHGIAVDSAGSAYVVGGTASDAATFPVLVGPSLSLAGNWDAFVAKVQPSGAGLVYCGYIGGVDGESASEVVVDAEGCAYVVGRAESDETTFPVAVGPDLTYGGGVWDGFVAKVNAAGSALVYCGYTGGAGTDDAYDIAVDAQGRAYVAGQTTSDPSTFPVVVGPDLTYNDTGQGDAFVARVASTGASFDYCGYIGGNAADGAYGIAVDDDGCARVVGKASSDEATFPVSFGPDTSHNGADDAWVAKVASDGTSLGYCGFIGGALVDSGGDIALDAQGYAYITGTTYSDETTFPVLVGPDLTFNGAATEADAFVVKVIDSPMFNDDCIDAWPVAEGVLPFSNLLANTDGPDEPGICDFFGYTQVDSDVWFRYTASASGEATVSLCGSLYDTKMAVYEGPSCPTVPGTAIACNDDACDLQSEVTFPATAGTEYLIRIGGYIGERGSGTMAIDVETLDCFPGTVNAGAGSVTDVLYVNGSTGGPGHAVTTGVGELVWASILGAPAGGVGKFVIHANFGEPSSATETPLPGGVGTACFPVLLPQGATPDAVWNNIGKTDLVGSTRYFDGSALPDPARAPTVFLVLFGGDSVNLPVGTSVTFQGILLDPGSASSKGGSTTNAVVLRIQ
jgi:hypothetical protein